MEMNKEKDKEEMKKKIIKILDEIKKEKDEEKIFSLITKLGDLNKQDRILFRKVWCDDKPALPFLSELMTHLDKYEEKYGKNKN